MTYPNNANTYLPGVIFIPSTLLIAAITQSYPMVLTATVPTTGSNTYIVGQQVRLNIPYSYGMPQANGLIGQIMAINGLNFTIDINSSGFDPFAIPGSTAEAPASMAPSGSRNVEYNNSTNQLAFQPLNNIGN